jgi:hypothetical protein
LCSEVQYEQSDIRECVSVIVFLGHCGRRLRYQRGTDRTLQCNPRHGMCLSPSHRIIFHLLSTRDQNRFKAEGRTLSLTERVVAGRPWRGSSGSRRNKHTELRRRLPLFKLYPVPGQPAPPSAVSTPRRLSHLRLLSQCPASRLSQRAELGSTACHRAPGLSAVKEPQTLQDSAMVIHRTGGQGDRGLASDCEPT